MAEVPSVHWGANSLRVSIGSGSPSHARALQVPRRLSASQFFHFIGSQWPIEYAQLVHQVQGRKVRRKVQPGFLRWGSVKYIRSQPTPAKGCVNQMLTAWA